MSSFETVTASYQKLIETMLEESKVTPCETVYVYDAFEYLQSLIVTHKMDVPSPTSEEAMKFVRLCLVQQCLLQVEDKDL